MYKPPYGLVLRVSTIADPSLLFFLRIVGNRSETNGGGSQWPGNEEKMCIVGGKDAHPPFLDLFPSLYRDTIVYIPGNRNPRTEKSFKRLPRHMIFSRMILVLDGNGGSVFHRRWDSFVDRYASSFWLRENGKEMRKCTKQTWICCRSRLSLTERKILAKDLNLSRLKEQLVSNFYSLHCGLWKW